MPPRPVRSFVVLGISLLLLPPRLVAAPAAAEAGRGGRPAAILSGDDLHHPVYGRHGMVASQHHEATRVGVEVLAAGGNAIDAAVAVSFALAVVLPRAGNLGGGGFLLAHLATGDDIALDYRETAPAAAHPALYLDEAGEVDVEALQFSHRAAGVPGSVAGLARALEHWGTMPLAEVIAPAIRLAEEGFTVTDDLARNLEELRDRLGRWPASAAVFCDPDGAPWRAGERLVQRDLAWTLHQIAEHGPRAFYDGAIAERLVADQAAHNGLITRDDLRAYRPVERTPVRGTYRGVDVVSMPPPSSGGVHLIQILNTLEGFPLGYLGSGSAETYHLMTEAMKLAYADRATHLGDPDYWPVPVDWLISKGYARDLRQRIDRDRATPSKEIGPGDPSAYESPDTTHFSVTDRHGNVVAVTTTLNYSYGSGIVAAGTGFLLNNEMDDFAAKPGFPNAYGLIGGRANAVEAGKRPLSSMTPTILLRDGRPFLVTGSPGGSRIITTVLQVVLNVVDHGMNVAEAVHAPRIHHQWLPDELDVEQGISPDTVRLLAARGHILRPTSAMGSANSILIDETGFYGAADPRRPDAAAAGY